MQQLVGENFAAKRGLSPAAEDGLGTFRALLTGVLLDDDLGRKGPDEGFLASVRASIARVRMLRLSYNGWLQAQLGIPGSCVNKGKPTTV